MDKSGKMRILETLKVVFEIHKLFTSLSLVYC